MDNPMNRTRYAAARRDFQDPDRSQGSDYGDFLRIHGREVLADAVKAIDPVRMGMDRKQAMTLAGAMKVCGFDRSDYDAIMQKDPQNKGTFGEQWDRWTGTGTRKKTATEGTIYDYAKRSGWKWPSPFDMQSGSRDPGSPQDPQPAAPGITLQNRLDIKVSCLMDPVQYKNKPEKAGEIRNREAIPTPAPTEYTLQDFARAVTAGQTFYPTVYSKQVRRKDGSPVLDKSGKPIYDYLAVSQQIFVVDIDNEEQVRDETGKTQIRRIKDPLTIPAALELCNSIGIEPFMVYETFSSKKHRDDPELPYQKFRLCFATDKPITVQEYGENGLLAAREYLVKLFGPAADQKTIDNARLIYGTDEKDRATLRAKILDHQKFTKVMYEDPEPLWPPVDPEEEKEKILEEYLKHTGSRRLPGFIDGIVNQSEAPYIPTGYSYLDTYLDGGLYEGLYVLGAVSSLGKTTFALQMADQIALSGHDVLIFSLEMSADELIAKSISRQTMRLALARDMAAKAKTQRGISVYNKYQYYDQDELKLIEDAEAEYEKFADHIFIFDDFMGINVQEVGEIVRTHIALTGSRPIVIVDYLQVLEPYSKEYIRASDKQNADKNIKELKLLSRDLHLPVFAISSFNRTNYNTEANMAAFKESGGIEYGADCIMAMQPQGIGDSDFDIDEAKKKEPREIELKILKQRGGAPIATVSYNYYSHNNYFEESWFDKIDRPREQEPIGLRNLKHLNDQEVGTGKNGKVTRRDKERKKILDAFNEVSFFNGGIVRAQDLADYLGISTNSVKNKIRDLGLDLAIDGEIKKHDAEITDPNRKDVNPFEPDQNDSN